jgi:hypothetical protein
LCWFGPLDLLISLIVRTLLDRLGVELVQQLLLFRKRGLKLIDLALLFPDLRLQLINLVGCSLLAKPHGCKRR